MVVVGWFFGAAVGYSLSALFPVNPPHGRIRVTAMQPHGMTDYLHRREIAVELGLAAFGWASVMVGSLALSTLVGISMPDETVGGLRQRADPVPVARRLLPRSPTA